MATVPFSVLVAKKGVRLYSRATGQNANIVIDASSNLGEINRPWEMLAQGGEQTTLFDVVNEVKEINIKYIRIDHVYDQYEVMPNAGTYDFSKLDKTVDAIISMGAKPMIALSYMPQAISSSDIIGLPRNWGDWQELVRRTVEHYSGRNNKAISDIYYEVWNEPDLFGSFKIGGAKDYRLLYLHASRGAASAQNVLPFKIGGPGTTAPYRNWMVGLLQFAASENLRIDFLSWHRYHYYPEQFSEDINNVNYWISGFSKYRNIEKLVTEWGSDSEVRPVHDGIFDLAHTIAISRVFIDRVNHAYSFEVKDGPGESKFWGRWGLLTNDKFGISKKPRYFAFKALAGLQGNKLSLNGEGTWVTGMSGKTGDLITAVIVNYDNYGRHSEITPVSFSNMGAYKYKVTKTFFGPSNPEGVKTESEEKTSNGSLSFNLNFTPNTAYLLELERLTPTITYNIGRTGQLNDKSIEVTSVDSSMNFSVFDVLDPKKGVIDFWVKPKWSGNDGGNYTFFEMPRTDGKIFGAYKRLIGTSRVLEFGVFPDTSVSMNVSHWNASEWHNLVFVWDFTLGNQSYLRMEIDGVSGPSVMGNVEPGLATKFYLGTNAEGNSLINADIDDFKTTGENQSTIKMLNFDTP